MAAAAHEVVDLCDSEDEPEMERWMAEVQDVCPSIPSEAIYELLLETRDPVKTVHKLLDRGQQGAIPECTAQRAQRTGIPNNFGAALGTLAPSILSRYENSPPSRLSFAAKNGTPCRPRL